MTLARNGAPVILSDGLDVKADQVLLLLRASLPVGRYRLTWYEAVHLQKQTGNRVVQQRRLQPVAP